MVVAIGVDLVHIPRFTKAILRYGERLARRVLSANEFKEYLALAIKQDHFLAKRFAAREACAKALGTGMSSGVSWQDFEVCHNKQGTPMLRLHARARNLANHIGAINTHLSLSDEGEYAMAFVVLTRSNNLAH